MRRPRILVVQNVVASVLCVIVRHALPTIEFVALAFDGFGIPILAFHTLGVPTMPVRKLPSQFEP